MADPRISDPRFAEARDHMAAIRRWAETLDPAARARIDDALDLMVELHLDQPDRPGPQPYVEHTAEVARNVIEWTDPTSPEVVIAACLHDAVEDQASKLAGQSGLEPSQTWVAALNEIRRRFGHRVASLVASVTNPDIDAFVTERYGPVGADERQARMNEIYTEHVLAVFENEPEAAAIKLADLGSNALRLDRVDVSTGEGRARKEKLIQKYRPTMRFLLDYLASIPSGHPLHGRREQLLAEISHAWDTEFRAPRGAG